MLKNVTGYSRRAGNHPGTVDHTLAKYTHGLLQVPENGWGKGDLFESPLRTSTRACCEVLEEEENIKFLVKKCTLKIS